MSYIHEWTIEEDDYLLLGHKNGVSMTRMARRIGLHRQTVKRRLKELVELYTEDCEAYMTDNELRNHVKQLEDRQPKPFVLWANAMINLNERANNGNYSE